MVFPLALLAPIAIKLAAEYAPDFIRHIGCEKAGDVAESVVGIARTITGIDDPEKAAAAVHADPALALQFKRHLASLEADLEKAYLADRQNARSRDVEMRKAGYRNTRADLMLGMAFTSFVALCVILYLGRLDLPGEIISIITMAIGAILKMIGDAFQFEFGSSRGSKEKDAALRS